MPIRLKSDRASLGRPNDPGRRSSLLEGEPCSGVTHQIYDCTDGEKPPTIFLQQIFWWSQGESNP